MVLDDTSLAPYRGSEPYIFVSYSHRNAARVAEIISRLNRSGFRVWYDEGLIPGREWDDNIARIIMGCSYFIALLTRDYLASSNCKDELNFARDKDKPLILIYLDEVALPAGMELRLGRLFAVHKAQYANDEAFYAKVFSADGLVRCNRRYTPSAAQRASSAPSARPKQPDRPRGAKHAPDAAANRAPSRKTTRAIPEPEPSKSVSPVKVLGAILLVALLAAAAWYLYTFYSTAPAAPQVTPPIQSASPTASNEAELDIEATPTPLPTTEESPSPSESVPTPTPTDSTAPTPVLPPDPTPEPTPAPPEEPLQVVEPAEPDSTDGSENTVIVVPSDDPDGTATTVITDITDQDTTLG